MNPHVTAICLTDNRQQFTDRAVACFRSQNYAEKQLLILDTGSLEYRLPVMPVKESAQILLIHLKRSHDSTIGSLRNAAVRFAHSDSKIIIHWDSDDWSSPRRMTEQVEALGRAFEVTGYSTMAFWDYERSEAWLYDHRANSRDTYCLGTSLAYTREAWNERPFKATSSGEDIAFCAGRRIISGSSVRPGVNKYMMLGAIHAGNQGGNYRIETRTDRSQGQWTRLAVADSDVKRIMEL
jgi:hypothetical protein